MAKNQPVGDCGSEVVEAPRSRAREIVSRGDSPSAAFYGELVHHSIADNLLGGLTPREAGVTFSGVRTMVAVARNRDSIDSLCEDMAEVEAERASRRAAELRAELAALETAQIHEPVKKVSRTNGHR